MTAMLVFGLLLGMRHALDADHLAAVATLVSRHNRPGDALRQGLAWGVGHTLTLLVFGSLVIWMDRMIPEHLAQGLELLVGLMLVVLGLDVLRRLYRDRLQVHGHPHGGLHAHGHPGGLAAGSDPGQPGHPHRAGPPLRALFIGIMHGMAGSAALILLTLETVGSPWLGMAYMGLFGIGSIIGMALLSLVMAIPLRRSARGLGWFHNSLQMVVGAASVFLGMQLVTDILALGLMV
jgi:cytochrome c biogenesis protein CcdA